MPLGIYCLNKPFVFSLLSRCHGLRGSSAPTSTASAFTPPCVRGAAPTSTRLALVLQRDPPRFARLKSKRHTERSPITQWLLGACVTRRSREQIHPFHHHDRRVHAGDVRADVPEHLRDGPCVLQPDSRLDGAVHGWRNGHRDDVVHAGHVRRQPQEHRHLDRCCRGVCGVACTWCVRKSPCRTRLGKRP